MDVLEDLAKVRPPIRHIEGQTTMATTQASATDIIPRVGGTRDELAEAVKHVEQLAAELLKASRSDAPTRATTPLAGAFFLVDQAAWILKVAAAADGLLQAELAEGLRAAVELQRSALDPTLAERTGNEVPAVGSARAASRRALASILALMPPQTDHRRARRVRETALAHLHAFHSIVDPAGS